MGTRVRELFGDASKDSEWADVRLRVRGQLIVAADAPGMSRDLTGLTLLEAAAVPGDRLAGDALANAISQAIRLPADPERVAVAMSGGVDSGVALLRSLPNAVGVTLRLWLDPAGPDAERACCSPDAVIAARQACHALGIPHVTIDARERFRRAIVSPFVAAYARGETPNPCTRCNDSFRFDELLSFARRIGAAKLATGHYARIVEHDGTFALARGVDEAKDQTYMLAGLKSEQLARIAFPLGTSTKTEIRAEAAAAGLAAAKRAESQEACFLAGGDYRDFLTRQGLAATPGVIVDGSGKEVGEHDGFWRFTPGQRRGLGVSASEPLYAVGTTPRTNTVVVGPREALARTEVRVRGRVAPGARRVEAKLRYRSPAVPATVEPTASGFRLTLDEPAYAVARGQAAVLYADGTVVGSGVITGASR
ncbi:MAG: tRNA 2-thiouridine(34) synthase MnmA [Actinobacteria bacterium]|nr:tRNA 2-thiouridine(34) synthase MnmA [Actinomycetota bacterium]